MSRGLILRQVGPGLTVQDGGRSGYLAYGLSRGGAADRWALAEGAALLGQDPGLAALEMAGVGGVFEATEDLRIALTGAPMTATIDGARAAWNASHLLQRGAEITIGGAPGGSYAYLHVGGGLAFPSFMGAQSQHLAAGVGAPLEAGALCPVGPDQGKNSVGLTLVPEARFGGGLLRVVPSQQTKMYEASEIARFEATEFTRDMRANRMGVRVVPEGDGFSSAAGLTVLSEIIVPGDIQVTGDGTPFVLMSESQTTGGYPRIGSVIPTDLPRVAQARPGTALRFQFITIEEAVAIEAASRARLKALPSLCTALTRDPHEMADLLSYQLIGGVTAGDDLEEEDTP